MGKSIDWVKHPELFDDTKELVKTCMTYAEVLKELIKKHGDAIPGLKTYNPRSLSDHMSRFGVKFPFLQGHTKSEHIHLMKDLPGGLSQDGQALVSLLRKKSALTVSDISRMMNKSKEFAIQLVDEVNSRGYNIEIRTDRRVVLRRGIDTSASNVNIAKYFKNDILIGAIGDTQLGSKYQQLGLLEECYKIGEKEGIQVMIHAGDLVDGFGMYKGQEQEIFKHGADDQAKYVEVNYPKTNKFKTHIISGNHDLSFFKTVGFDIVRNICEVRKDLVYDGQVEGLFHFGGIKIDVLHPSGGVAYARSYKPQKIVEGLVGAVVDKMREGNADAIPHIQLMGHWHVVDYLPYMGVDCLTVPCLQAQTPYLRAKGLHPVLGMWLFEISHADGRIVRFKPTLFKMLPKDNDY